MDRYSLPKIWVKLAHTYTADTRLSPSSPPRALLESMGMRLYNLSQQSFTYFLSIQQFSCFNNIKEL